ncbi:MAG: Ig-like domain repeat protein [Methanosphaera sp.]|nr:Ig-like domain repeat protein [Methanosphaera sp.]
MKLNKIFFVVFITLLVMGLTIVSAHDSSTNANTKHVEKSVKNTTKIVNKETKNQKNNVKKTVTNKDNKISKKYNKTIKTSSKTVNNYNELYNTLTSDTESDLTISLAGDQTYQISETITLNNAIKTLKIDGNARTIDGNNQKKFLIIDHPTKAIFNNITFTRCNNTKDGYENASGGVLSAKHSNLTFNDVNFTKNSISNHYIKSDEHYIYSDSRGGAIKADYCNVFINNSNFEDNNVTYTIPERMTSSYVTSYGGAIDLNNSNMTITSSKFTNNSALPYSGNELSQTGGGGAISAEYSNINIDQTRFIKNVAFYGAVILNGVDGWEPYEYNYGNLTVTNSLIESNGYINETSDYKMGSTGMIYLKSFEKSYLKNVTFTKNFGSGIRNPVGNLTVDSCNFIKNGDESHYAYAIHNQENLTINNSNFKDYYAEESIILNYGRNLIIDNSNFTNNLAFLWSAEGAAVFSSAGYTGFMVGGNSEFEFHLPKVLINNSVFEFNRVGDEEYTEYYGGAVGQSAGELTIDNTLFNSNEAFCAGALYLEKYYHYESGIPTEILYPTVIIINSNFTNNKAYNFSDPTSNYDMQAGAIYSDAFLNIDNCNFINNSISASEYCYGGAIYAEKELTVTNSSFISNNIKSNTTRSQTIHGAAIYNNQCEKLIIKHNMFVNNTPFNFKVSKQSIVLNRSDAFIPKNGEIVLYVENSSETKKYDLENSIVKDFIVDYDDLYYVIVSSAPNTSVEEYENNVFLIPVPKNYTLTIKAKDTQIYDETEIKGEFYYIKKDNSKRLMTNTELELYVNGKLINKTRTDENGKYSFTYKTDKMGTNEIIIRHSGTFVTEVVTNRTSFEVSKRRTVITLNPVKTVKIGDNTYISGTLSEYNLKPIADKVTIYLDNKPVNITTDKNGNFKYNYKTVTSGENNVIVVYDGNDIYLDSLNTTSFNVIKYDTIIKITATDTTYNNESIIRGQVIDDKKISLKNVTLLLYVNDDKFDLKTNEKGEFSYKYNSKLLGENHVSVFFEGNDKFKDASNKTSFMVSKTKSQVTVSSKNIVLKQNTTIKGKLLDINNKAISKATIIIIFDGKSIANVKTDSKGKYSYSYKPEHNGTYNITVIYEGDKNYHKSSNTTKIIVKPIIKNKTSITVTSKTIENGDNVTFVATVKDKNGKAINEGKVIFKINMKTVTDSKGNAIYAKVKNGKAKISIQPTEGLYNKNSDLNAVFGETDKYQRSISKTAKLLLVKKEAKISFNTNNIKAKSGDTIKIKVKIVDNNGKPVNKGKVTFKINSKSIGKVKVKDSTAQINYKLNRLTAKVYKITAVFSDKQYKRIQKTINLTVSKSPTYISLNPINGNKKYAIVKAKLLDKKNQPITTKTKVSIKINGHTKVKEIKVTNGTINQKIATNLDKGTYTLTIISGTNDIYQESRNSTTLTIK